MDNSHTHTCFCGFDAFTEGELETHKQLAHGLPEGAEVIIDNGTV